MDPGSRSQEAEPEPPSRRPRAPTALTVECGVCSEPAPDHLHFGGTVQLPLSSSLHLTLLSPSTLLLLLPGLLQTESHQEGGAEVQDQSRGLSGRHKRQEVHRLQVPEVSPHWDGPPASPGDVRPPAEMERRMTGCCVQGSRKRQRKREDIDVEETTETVETNEHLDTVDSDHHLLSPVEHKPFSPSFSHTNHSQTSTSSSSFKPLTFPRRESVIKRVGREDRTKLNLQADVVREGPSKLTMQAEILKSYGNILTHTGRAAQGLL